MCILFVFIDPEPSENSYRLIIASNRDEYFKRPSKIAYHCDETGIIAGRDMEVGREYGTWLGITTKENADAVYRFGALLNVTGETKQAAKGRGFIVIDYLKGEDSVQEYQKQLHNEDDAYNGYNFITIDLGSDIIVNHISNIANEIDKVYKGKQCLVFGNSTVTSPLSKVKGGKILFESIIKKYNNKKCAAELKEQLLKLLKHKERFLPDPELANRAPKNFTELSSIYVDMQGYGTRTHTLILVDYDWKLHFTEVTMKNPDNISVEWEETDIIYNKQDL